MSKCLLCIFFDGENGIIDGGNIFDLRRECERDIMEYSVIVMRFIWFMFMIILIGDPVVLMTKSLLMTTMTILLKRLFFILQQEVGLARM